MDLLKNVQNLIHRSHMNNKEVMKRAKTESYLLKSIQMRKYQYFGHIVRAACVGGCVESCWIFGECMRVYIESFFYFWRVHVGV